MKLIIAGSRDIVVDAAQVEDLIHVADALWGYETSEIHTGDARGVDAAARELGAAWRHPELHETLHVYPADWETHGKAAGPIRNAEMAEAGDALLLIWDGKSRGSASMKREAEKRGLPIVEVVLHPGVKP